ncbi:His-Xaa-Ser system radical SAM maturase HxsC [Sphingomonas guangdongensis]|uniref:His-Xaa-Ser system radical SAM maturase HxsC n=1 Tax=Sphingomonas guangdongensis TaxID=1141890 RepID=A0A285QGV7_9SPHN|nr:His-Xaa-Ser system radical SAM maturase HxsC [Sphingomonas guangdongensis]SOB80748.1 His-Xaa-Ser system radical SAM maturase HxsC [Sphingomonas guangdongensis]
MIPLTLPAAAEAELSFVTRLRTDGRVGSGQDDSPLLGSADGAAAFLGRFGLFELSGAQAEELNGDVVLVEPDRGRAQRLLRAGSDHNTLLVTERCDQLCVMCSQPPKKTHEDRFHHFERACLLAEPDAVIGVSGGEPTLYKERLLAMLERVLTERSDLSFHVLTNGQHFDGEDVARLRGGPFDRVTWGIPLYASDAELHDRIVGKKGAFDRLGETLAHLMLAGAAVELRTVLLSDNAPCLPQLARHVTARLGFVASWSIMQLENAGFARGRWSSLRFAHEVDFASVAIAVDHALLHGVDVRLFNFPRCTVPDAYRPLAPASISDWKRRYAPACDACSAKADCTGFFEWHPEEEMIQMARPI